MISTTRFLSRRRTMYLLLCLYSLVSCSRAFAPVVPKLSPSTALNGYNSVGKPYDRRGGGAGDVKSKRQERVGQLVQTELSQILHTGLIKGHDAEYLEDELRCRISVVSSDVSPDLRQARISVSVRAGNSKRTVTPDGADSPSPAVDRRRAYAWLVRNTKPIRHALAQRMSHMKSCPELTFVQVDVSAAVDVMYLIDKVSAGSYKRDNLDLFDPDEVAQGIVGGLDFDEDDEDDDWDEDDGDFFNNKSS